MSFTLIGILGFVLVLAALRRSETPEREPLPIPVNRQFQR